MLVPRKQFAAPVVRALSVKVEPFGTAHTDVACTDAKAIRLAAATAGTPTDAAARAAALTVLDANGMASLDLTSALGGILTVGQTAYVKAFGYEAADGTGNESAAYTAQATFSALKRANPWDDNKYALKASDTVGKETDDDLFVADTKTLKVGTVASPSSLSKTVRFPCTVVIPADSGMKWTVPGGGVFIGPFANNVQLRAEGQVVLSYGVTITAFRARLFRQTTSDVASLEFFRVASDTFTSLGLLTHNTTGWATFSSSLTESVSAGRFYAVEILLTGVVAFGNAAFGWLEVDYTMPSYDKGI